MKIGRNICLICVFAFAAATSVESQNKNVCIDSLSYKVVQSRWNQKVKKIKMGTWKLIITPNLDVIKDSVSVKQSLHGSSLYFVATVLKHGCVKSISIKARRDKEIGHASILAWLYLIDSCNPELSTEDRNSVLDDLKITQDISFFTASTIRGNNTYKFDEGPEGNTFTVTTKN